MKRYAGKFFPFLCGLLLLIFSIIYQSGENISNAKDWIRMLSNAALVPGVLLTGIGLLILIAGEGIFDGMKYTLSNIMTHLRRVPKKHASYYEYTQREKKQGNTNSLLLPGIFYLAVAVILTVVYYL